MCNVRVEIKSDGYMSNEQKFKIMFHEFNLKVQKAGIKNLYKQHSYFESKSRKKRRERKESLIKRNKEQNLLKRMEK